MKFNEKVVKLRKLKGLTQDEFASAVGVSRQAVYKWESGQSYPEVSKLVEMKLLFGISIDDLLDESYEVVLPEKKKRKRVSREKKAEIEAVVNSEVGVKEEPKDETVTETVTVAAVKEESGVAERDPSVEEREAVAESAQIPQEATPAVEEILVEKKRVGLLGRIFGRK